MTESSNERAVQFIESVHDRLAEFGRESHGTDGRGVIRVSVPEVAPGTRRARRAMVSTEMVYHTLSEVRRLTAGLQGTIRDDADVLLRMIETYDPSMQAVVTVAVGSDNPVSVKIRLERPFLVDKPDGVH